MRACPTFRTILFHLSHCSILYLVLPSSSLLAKLMIKALLLAVENCVGVPALPAGFELLAASFIIAWFIARFTAQ